MTTRSPAGMPEHLSAHGFRSAPNPRDPARQHRRPGVHDAALRSAAPRYPRSHIAALVNSYNAGVLAGNPDVDAVHSLHQAQAPRGGRILAWDAGREPAHLPQLRRAALRPRGAGQVGLRPARPRARAPDPPAVGVRPQRPASASPPEAPVDQEVHEVEVMMKLGARSASRAAWPGARVRRAGARRAMAQPLPRARAARRSLDRPPYQRAPAAPALGGRAASSSWRGPSRATAIGFVLRGRPAARDDPRHPGDDDARREIVTGVGSWRAAHPARKPLRSSDLIAGVWLVPRLHRRRRRRDAYRRRPRLAGRRTVREHARQDAPLAPLARASRDRFAGGRRFQRHCGRPGRAGLDPPFRAHVVSAVTAWVAALFLVELTLRTTVTLRLALLRPVPRLLA